MRGIGVALDELPVQRENSGSGEPNKFKIIKKVVDGRNVIGYIIQNGAGQTRTVRRDLVIKLASEGHISNACIMNPNNNIVLCGTNGTNLQNLPCVDARTLSRNQ